ncbi:MAG: hypothetical protein V2I33_23935 [Kangiellaceae bacterium]|jgi:hypothetical protein|nr:hypothetical protein [Kangiellaceae bacterium]
MDVSEVQLDVEAFAPLVLHLTKHNMMFYNIESGALTHFTGGEHMFFHRAVWVDAQTYYLDGALRLEKRIEH